MELHRNASAAASTTGFRNHPHHRKARVSDRLLSIAPHSHPHPQTSTTTFLENELTEDDIFCSSPESSSSSSSSAHPTPTRSASANSHFHSHSHNHQGILAALPGESESETRSVFNHKVSSASVSSTSPSSSASFSVTPSSSSSRIIIPRRPPPPRRLAPQSAPVNVPVISEAMRRSRALRGFDDVIDDNDDEDIGEMMPPHEIVAAKNMPIAACSVLEGIGRTLKGRDLRQVRNAVWQRTGFLD